jgi:membrane protein DedA with SNARE-associated domain
MESFITHFGLVAVFVGATIEGDLVLILAGVTAHLGLLNLWAAIAAAATGCFTGDFAFYALGRWHSDTIRNSRVYLKFGPRVERLANRVGFWQIFAARFMYGTRVATMLFWGAHRLPIVTFVAVNLAGCTAWAVILGLLGFGASRSAAVLLGDVKRAELWLVGAIAVAIAGYLVVRQLRKRANLPAPK